MVIIYRAVILQCSFSVTDITDTLSDGISPFLNFIKHTVRSESDGAITQSLDSELDDNNLCFSTDSALTSPFDKLFDALNVSNYNESYKSLKPFRMPYRSDQRLKTKDQKLKTKDQRSKTKNQRPKTKNQRPKTKNQRPKTQDQRPKTNNQTPNTKHQKPNTKNQRPKTQDQRPKARDQ